MEGERSCSSLTRLHNNRRVNRIGEYRDSRNNLKSFTRGGFPQSLIETDKFETWDLTDGPYERISHQESSAEFSKTSSPPFPFIIQSL